MANRKISDLTALTAPAAGDYLPIVDISEAAAASKNKRITIEELFRGVPLGTAAAPSIAIEGDENTGIYSPGADQLAVATNGTGRLFISSTGLVGVGTSSPSEALTVSGKVQATTEFKSETGSDLRLNAGSANRDIFMQVNGSTLMTVQGSTGRVGIGTTSPTRQLDVRSTAFFDSNGDGTGTSPSIAIGSTSVGLSYVGGGHLSFTTGSAEKARIDSSGRLLVGTSTSASVGVSQYARLQIQGNTFGTPDYGILSVQRSEAATSISSGEDLGRIVFTDSAGNEFGGITCVADAAAGNNDYPGRLTFSTTADGASSPTERMRITNDGDVYIGQTTTSTPGSANTTAGLSFRRLGQVYASVNSDQVMVINRSTNDGNLILFNQDGTQEGSISVSGTTVSYNGAHLSRWSQLPSGAERTEILRGSVLSNIDEMCEWGKEDNEQLNRMKVSDVEGDKNVSGVFQCWDDDDDTYTNDFYCAMTGDFIIRIAEGITVERGDLLMSAGDGTAKPQDDDIIRSKTIAKVTSTNVSCTYDDGSYCVPCVLMAC